MTANTNRPIHDYEPHDGGRFARSSSSYYAGELDDPVGIAKQIIPLLQSQDPEDRRDAARLVWLLDRAIYCPDSVWVCKSRYEVQANGKRWSDSECIWSAHLTEAEANRWHTFWTNHWKSRRSDYEMLPVVQQSNVPLTHLRHPEAIVGEGVNT